MYSVPGVQNVGTAQRDVSKEKKTTRGWCKSVLRAALHYPNAWNRLKKILIFFFNCHRFLVSFINPAEIVFI